MQRFLLAAAILGASLLAAQAADASRMPRRMLRGVEDDVGPVVPGANILASNSYTKVGNAADSFVKAEAQAQAREGNTDSALPVVADSVAAGQVKSDTRQSLAKSGAQAVVQLASSGDNDGTTGAGAAAAQHAGMSSFTSFGQGQAARSDMRASLARADAKRAIGANMDDGFAAAGAATDAVVASTYGTRTHSRNH